MSPFHSPMGGTLERFLKHKRSLGHVYKREEAQLRALDRLAAASNEAVLTEPLMRTYITAKSSISSRPNRLTIVRQLAQFIALETPGVFVPPVDFLGIRRMRTPIQTLSREECARFLDACDRLPGSRRWPQRGHVHGTVLRTLLLTGLRRGEVLRLKVADVDLNEGVLHVVKSKFRKSRLVPVAADLHDRLIRYDRSVDERVRDRERSDAFFPGPDGHSPGTRRSLYESFRRVLDIAGIPHRGRGRGPRCHDLRHAFAVLKLLSWYERGVDVNAKLPLLATYIGHVGISSLQVYLHMTRDLVGEVVKLQRQRFGDLITAEARP